MKNLISDIKVYFTDPKLRLTFGLTAFVFVALLANSARIPERSSGVSPVSSADLIPDGYSLVPLELVNAEALQSLVGAYAVVDLFGSPTGRGKGDRIGRRIKIIRAPEDPSQFAALLPENEALSLIRQPAPLFAVIQSRQTTKKIGKSAPVSRIQIHQGDLQ